MAWKLRFLFHILSSLAVAALAPAIRMQISAIQLPSFDKVAPRYLELDTSIMVTLTLALLVLITITLNFSVLGFIPYAAALSTSLWVRSCSSILLPTTWSIWRYCYFGHSGFPTELSPETN